MFGGFTKQFRERQTTGRMKGFANEADWNHRRVWVVKSVSAGSYAT